MRWGSERDSGAVFTRLALILLTFLTSATWLPRRPAAFAMRVDPERIAARLRIEQEIAMDKLSKLGRNRRQLAATPKEISISITAPLFSSRLFEYGTDAGDEELPPSLDAAKKITIAYPLRFYGMDSSTVYVSPPHVFV
ncbi:unnamed protein product [Gongylonema pulchrum]|uniref:Uncharacterized protein n=1 Tax=Gongylonema pulchrum TaxID=637853 RepID=A0A183EEZ5_9BILA|nr:unnamed protein product [Gongylonema pulchrum]